MYLFIIIRRQLNTVRKGHARKLFREPLIHRDPPAYEVNTMKSLVILSVRTTRERFILIDGERGANFNDQHTLTRHPRFLNIIFPKSHSGASTKHASFRLTVRNWVHEITFVYSRRIKILSRNRVLFSSVIIFSFFFFLRSPHSHFAI